MIVRSLRIVRAARPRDHAQNILLRGALDRSITVLHDLTVDLEGIQVHDLTVS